jgi:hypothetical protein
MVVDVEIRRRRGWPAEVFVPVALAVNLGWWMMVEGGGMA